MTKNVEQTWEEQAADPASSPATGKWVLYPKADGWYAMDDAGTVYGPFSSESVALLSAATELTITAGSVTATQSHHTIDTQADASTDDLDTISGGQDGELLYVRAEHTDRTVVLKHGTGNIYTPSGSDVSLESTEHYAILLYDSTVGGWVVLNEDSTNTGDVVGPGSSTDNALARWDGVGGDTLQDSGVLVDDNGRMTFPDDAATPPLNVTERSAEPTTPSSGDIYLDDGTNTASALPGWRRYDGAAWEDVAAAATYPFNVVTVDGTDPGADYASLSAAISAAGAGVTVIELGPGDYNADEEAIASGQTIIIKGKSSLRYDGTTISPANATSASLFTLDDNADVIVFGCYLYNYASGAGDNVTVFLSTGAGATPATVSILSCMVEAGNNDTGTAENSYAFQGPLNAFTYGSNEIGIYGGAGDELVCKSDVSNLYLNSPPIVFGATGLGVTPSGGFYYDGSLAPTGAAGGVGILGTLDEDNMASESNEYAATQQSIVSWGTQNADTPQWIPAIDFETVTGSPTYESISSSGLPGTGVWRMDQSVESFVQTTLALRQDRVPLYVDVYWYAGGTTGDVAVGVNAVPYAPGTDDITSTSTQSGPTGLSYVSVPGTAGELVRTRIGLTPADDGFNALDLIFLRVGRDGDDASDTATAPMRFIGVMVSSQ